MAALSSAAKPARQTAAAAASSALSALLMVLTFTTGVMDALSILGLGRVFTALMTGNVVFVGLSLADEPGFSALRSLWALGTFAAGAVGGGRMARAHAGSPLRAWLLRAGAVEAALLAAGASTVWILDPKGAELAGPALYGVIALTAAAMGLRSATVVPLADPDLKTTVLTLTITALAADSRLARGRGERWERRTLSILMLSLGALSGALCLRALGMAASLALMGALVMGATAAFAAHPSSAAPLASRTR